MQLTRAVIYRLFAPTGNPLRSFRMRCFGFVLAIVVLGGLATRAAPTYLWRYGRTNELLLVCALSCFFTSVTYLLSDGAHRVFMERLRILQYMPIRLPVLRRLQLLAYVPITCTGFAIIVPAMYKAFAYGANRAVLWGVICASFILTATCHVALRTAQSRLSEHARMIAAGSAGGMLLLAWEITNSRGAPWLWQRLLLLMIVVHVALCMYALRRPPKTTFDARITTRTEWRKVTIAGSFAIRAYRTRRYAGSNLLLLLILISLSVYAVLQKGAISYNAVAVLCLLLTGTLAQESRTLSPTYWPLELFLYSRFGRWLRATWLLAFANAIFFTELLLVTAVVMFPHSISVTYGQMICIGMCLTAVATVAGALAVPNKDDILAQFASTALYGGLAYGVMRLLGGQSGTRSLFLTAATVGAGLGLSYVVEKIRWLLSIKGRYAIFHR
jgi:hypothetical protein